MIRWMTILALMLWPNVALAQSEAESGALLKSALEAAEKKDWDRAEAIALRIPDPTAMILIDWTKLRSGEGTFDD